MKLFFSRAFAVAVVLVLTATGLGASPAGEEEPAATTEKEMVLDPSHRQDGERARVRRDLDLCHWRGRSGEC